jgi:hypothetical protein
VQGTSVGPAIRATREVLALQGKSREEREERVVAVIVFEYGIRKNREVEKQREMGDEATSPFPVRTLPTPSSHVT